MRNGNIYARCNNSNVPKFLPYLWGMETCDCQMCRVERESSYRTYEEWKPVYDNTVISIFNGSYRTYEEWKLSSRSCKVRAYHLFLPYLWGMETGLSRAIWSSFWGFLPYLWGMETFCIRSSLWLYLCVLTVPMRNGNSHGLLLRMIRIQFLPYLWGMETIEMHSERPDNEQRFLPYLWGMETLMNRLYLNHCSSSYRTYEEWKPNFANDNKCSNICSYRTYEEWKPRSYLFSLYTVSYVLTVPMRNGNYVFSRVYSSVSSFLPYLWGMETLAHNQHYQTNLVLTVPMRNGNSPRLSQDILQTRSYRTYEEWKLSSINIHKLLRKCSYRTYEEWKLK